MSATVITMIVLCAFGGCVHKHCTDSLSDGHSCPEPGHGPCYLCDKELFK